jgi:hypothetical protein
MTPAGLPTEHLPPAWHRRFPDRRLWAGRLRLWRVELAVRRPPSPLTDWIARAATRRLGLPASVVANVTRPTRQTFAFLDLPAGPRPVSSVPARSFDPWPEPITAVPPAVLHPLGVDVVPLSADWRTVPIVRAEAVEVVAVWQDDGIDVYAADAPDGKPLWELPADAMTGFDGVR